MLDRGARFCATFTGAQIDRDRRRGNWPSNVAKIDYARMAVSIMLDAARLRERLIDRYVTEPVSPAQRGRHSALA